MTNPRTGKVERVFVNLEAVYPNASDPNEEMSFEELRAQARGWLNKDWASEQNTPVQAQTTVQSASQPTFFSPAVDYVDSRNAPHVQPSPTATGKSERRSGSAGNKDVTGDGKTGRPKKMKIMEVKGETQTSQ